MRPLLAVLLLVGCLGDFAPPAPLVSITPTNPGPDEALLAVIDVPSSDPSGDSVALTVAWTLDGAAVASVGGTSIPADRTEMGQRWEISVVATIGDAVSAPGVASVVIGSVPGDDDDTPIAGSIPGSLCAGATVASNGEFTSTTCTGAVSTVGSSTNGTYTIQGATMGATP